MTSHPPAQCCTVGVKHEGEAQGEAIKIGDGIDAYLARPPKPTTKAIVLIADVLGHDFINTKLIADQFAANGYVVLVPDTLQGDVVPLNRPPSFDFAAWAAKHGVAENEPAIQAAIDEVRSKHGATRIGGVGYCWGGKYVARYLAKGRGFDVGYTAHPSFMQPDELKGVAGPLSISAAIVDGIFPREKRLETEDILTEIGVPWQISLYSGVQHGFAVRGDISVAEMRKAKELAFKQAVDWFNAYL